MFIGRPLPGRSQMQQFLHFGVLIVVRLADSESDQAESIPLVTVGVSKRLTNRYTFDIVYVNTCHD